MTIMDGRNIGSNLNFMDTECPSPHGRTARTPPIVTVPCFSGAPWNLKELECLSDIPMQTMRLPEGKDDIEDYADFVGAQVDDPD
jgi:hypothetical protein